MIRYPERAVLLEHRRTKHGIPINDVIDNTAMGIKAVEKSSGTIIFEILKQIYDNIYQNNSKAN